MKIQTLLNISTHLKSFKGTFAEITKKKLSIQ